MSRGSQVAWVIAGYLAVTLTAVTAFGLRGRVVELQRPLAARLGVTSDSALTVVLVVQPAECAGSLSIVNGLNDLHDAGVVLIKGVLLAEEAAIPNWRQLVGASGARFPFTLMEPPSVWRGLNRLGHDRTPLLVVFDGGGRLQAILRPDVRSLRRHLTAQGVTDRAM